jgi:hypothetical protein
MDGLPDISTSSPPHGARPPVRIWNGLPGSSDVALSCCDRRRTQLALPRRSFRLRDEIARRSVAVPWAFRFDLQPCMECELVNDPAVPGIAVAESIIDLNEPNIDGLELDPRIDMAD